LGRCHGAGNQNAPRPFSRDLRHRVLLRRQVVGHRERRSHRPPLGCRHRPEHHAARASQRSLGHCDSSRWPHGGDRHKKGRVGQALEHDPQASKTDLANLAQDAQGGIAGPWAAFSRWHGIPGGVRRQDRGIVGNRWPQGNNAFPAGCSLSGQCGSLAAGQVDRPWGTGWRGPPGRNLDGARDIQPRTTRRRR